METTLDKCNVCGETDTKLIDGFYYCTECGTQNANVKKTVLEEKRLADGTLGQSNKRKIIKIRKDGIEMSGEWYKWHAFNFIISGLADELISLGAKPTFKTKLLWIWTRYIKKYQNKAELMMNKTCENGNDLTALPSFMVEVDSNIEEENVTKESSKKLNKYDIVDGSKRDVKSFTRTVMVAMLYVALNLDENDIQLSHLRKYCDDKHLDLSNLKRFVPDNIDLKKIPLWLNFLRSQLGTHHQIRVLAVSLLKKLDLGTPKVPDLKKIVDNFLLELSLPNDMKPFVYSLMYYRRCDYLDIDRKALNSLIYIPDYEGTVMAFILIALKMCFGLDCDYEIKLSNIVEKINEGKNLQKSYKLGKYSEPTDRLFSFKEWCSHLRFRKTMLGKYNLLIANKYFLDIDDYVYLDQMEERPKKNEKLTDKISMQIISRLPQDDPVGIIPKELFTPSLTPLSDYTEIVIDYCQDPEIKLLLAEDFKSYSLKYACEDLSFCDSGIDNIFKGVSEDGKTTNNHILGTMLMKKANKKMIYIKNCENRNWLITKPPTLEHVSLIEEDSVSNDKDSDHGYDSECTPKDKDNMNLPNDNITLSNDDITLPNDNIALSNGDTTLLDDNKSLAIESTANQTISDRINESSVSYVTNSHEIIAEEDTDRNIFDDCFEDITFKEECEKDIYDNNHVDENEVDQIHNDDIYDEDFDRRSNISTDSSMPTFNPKTFDRNSAIKELILYACKNYKIPVPSEYRTNEPKPRKRREPVFGDESITVKRSKRSKYDGQMSVNNLLANYHNYVQADFVTKIQQEINVAIRNTELANQTREQNNFSSNNMEDDVFGSNIRENGLDSPVAGSVRHSSVNPTNGDNITNNDINDKTNLIDETTEKELFGDDEEMNLNDLISKGDPKFDESKYDINQLYIKIKDKPPDVCFDLNDEPEIEKILEKNSEECAIASAKLKAKLLNKEDSDSEDDIPLSVIKDEILSIRDIFHKEENYKALITNENISEFKYWIRHYEKHFIDRSKDMYVKFNEELHENIPSSFYFVLQECSSILNCSNFYLYKQLQCLETYFLCKSKKIKFHDGSDSYSDDFDES